LTVVVSSVTVGIDATVKGTDADHHELHKRGTAMIGGLYAVLKPRT